MAYIHTYIEDHIMFNRLHKEKRKENFEDKI